VETILRYGIDKSLDVKMNPDRFGCGISCPHSRIDYSVVQFWLYVETSPLVMVANDRSLLRIATIAARYVRRPETSVWKIVLASFIIHVWDLDFGVVG